ncbi:MAG: glycosyltransferase family 2 protein [Elusimicrobiales bacterium]|nr:glycosyltransferase family 2 protein [Elusimicrobiales bacterium]
MAKVEERPIPYISAVILARNEESNIGFCLDTLGWCREIVVVDMDSSDRTAEIAAARGAKVFRHPRVQAFDTAKKFAVDKASGDWIFLIDADEMAPKKLSEALMAAAELGRADVVRVPFVHYLLGAPVRRSGWGYTPQARFFRKGKVLFSGRIHGYFREADGAVIEDLPHLDANSIQHFNYRDAAHFVEKMNRYTSVEAAHMRETGVPFSCFRLLRAASAEFFYRYFPRGGYSEGVRGFSLCLMMAFYRALSYIKLWELLALPGGTARDLYSSERAAVLKGWGK